MYHKDGQSSQAEKKGFLIMRQHRHALPCHKSLRGDKTKRIHKSSRSIQEKKSMIIGIFSIWISNLFGVFESIPFVINISTGGL